MHHRLKTESRFYRRIESGDKTFEVRKNDRDFQAGDSIQLVEVQDGTSFHTGASIFINVDYVLAGGQYGIAPDYCVMSISKNRTE